MYNPETGKAMSASEYADAMVEQDPTLSKPEALHWIADSQDAEDLFIDEFTEEASNELARYYPTFSKNFWWVK